ncbi:MAG: ArgE/DapE family deacylase [Gemmatimonadaceae bacterium]
MTAIAPGDARALLRALVATDSRNPELVPGAPGEAAVALLLADVLRSWGFQVQLQEALPARPNVIARVGSTGKNRGGKSLLFNGHIDVVAVDGMTHSPFGADEREGRLYGRGASDMKAGVAAMCAAAHRALSRGLGGELIITAVVDEEFKSAGTRAIIEAGLRADAAIVTEPTRLAIMPAHRGFTWVTVTCRGRAAHGSRYDLGIDAILHAAHVMTTIDEFQRSELTSRTHPLLGHASLHAGTISGGLGWSTYPELCQLEIERRTLPGEVGEQVVNEIAALCDRVRQRLPSLDATVEHVFSQLPSDVPVNAPICTALADALRGRGESVQVAGMSAWTDAALLNAAGIPAICFGPGDMTLAHANAEWVELAEVDRACEVLAQLALSWCGSNN